MEKGKVEGDESEGIEKEEKGIRIFFDRGEKIKGSEVE